MSTPPSRVGRFACAGRPRPSHHRCTGGYMQMASVALHLSRPACGWHGGKRSIFSPPASDCCCSRPLFRTSLPSWGCAMLAKLAQQSKGPGIPAKQCHQLASQRLQHAGFNKRLGAILQPDIYKREHTSLLWSMTIPQDNPIAFIYFRI